MAGTGPGAHGWPDTLPGGPPGTVRKVRQPFARKTIAQSFANAARPAVRFFAPPYAADSRPIGGHVEGDDHVVRVGY